MSNVNDGLRPVAARTTRNLLNSVEDVLLGMRVEGGRLWESDRDVSSQASGLGWRRKKSRKPREWIGRGANSVEGSRDTSGTYRLIEDQELDLGTPCAHEGARDGYALPLDGSSAC